MAIGGQKTLNPAVAIGRVSATRLLYGEGDPSESGAVISLNLAVYRPFGTSLAQPSLRGRPLAQPLVLLANS
jgi:hypothetical protein